MASAEKSNQCSHFLAVFSLVSLLFNININNYPFPSSRQGANGIAGGQATLVEKGKAQCPGLAKPSTPRIPLFLSAGLRSPFASFGRSGSFVGSAAYLASQRRTGKLILQQRQPIPSPPIPLPPPHPQLPTLVDDLLTFCREQCSWPLQNTKWSPVPENNNRHPASD
jgi:hypothetical protein